MTTRDDARTWRAAVASAVVLMLVVAAGVGALWWYRGTGEAVARSSVRAAGPAASPPGPTGSPASSDVAGPALADVTGAGLPGPAAAGARRLYAALLADDTSTLAGLYMPDRSAGVVAWSVAARRLAPRTVREGLLTALRTPPGRPPDVSYLYVAGDYGVGLRVDGTVAFFGTGQAGRESRPDGSANPAGIGSSAAGGPVPTLGAAGWRPGTEGYGEVRPSTANADGDGTSVVEDLHWTSWGGSTATATGTGYWVPPSGFSSDAVATPAVVIASDLGDCQGHPAYRKIGWYFPGKGETASDGQDGYPDICTPF